MSEYSKLMERLQESSKQIGDGFNKLMGTNLGDALDKRFQEIAIALNKNNLEENVEKLCQYMVEDTIKEYNIMKNNGVTFVDKTYFIHFLNDLIDALDELPEDTRSKLIYIPRMSDKIKPQFIDMYMKKIKEIFITGLEKDL